MARTSSAFLYEDRADAPPSCAVPPDSLPQNSLLTDDSLLREAERAVLESVAPVTAARPIFAAEDDSDDLILVLLLIPLEKRASFLCRFIFVFQILLYR